MNNWIINNFWIKIISLLLAIITWFYVNEELHKEIQIEKQFYKSSILSQIKNPIQEKKPMNKGYLTEKK